MLHISKIYPCMGGICGFVPHAASDKVRVMIENTFGIMPEDSSASDLYLWTPV